MNSTIELDHEATLRAAEVDDEGTNWMLSAELHSIQATPAQFIPQEILDLRFTGTQIPHSRDVVPVVASSSHDKSFA